MRQDGNFAGEGQFRSRHQTHRQFGIIDGGEAACSGAEVMRHELIANLRGSRTYTVEAKVTHFWNSLVGSPQPQQDIIALAVPTFIKS